MHSEFAGSSLWLNRAGQFLSEYLLAVQPDQFIQERVRAERLQFGLTYQQSVESERTVIPLASFLAKEMMEETILRWVQRICNLQRSFEVSLSSYGGIHPHTICFRVEDPQPFRLLTAQLKMVDQFIQSNDCPPALLYPLPYLPLACDLPEAVYMEALHTYAEKQFSARFRVETILLLKRTDMYEKWQPVNQFTLPPSFSAYE